MVDDSSLATHMAIQLESCPCVLTTMPISVISCKLVEPRRSFANQLIQIQFQIYRNFIIFYRCPRYLYI